jgi:hypothetical protein
MVVKKTVLTACRLAFLKVDEWDRFDLNPKRACRNALPMKWRWIGLGTVTVHVRLYGTVQTGTVTVPRWLEGSQMPGIMYMVHIR